MDLIATIRAHGQEQVLRFLPSLTPTQKDELLGQLGALDWSRIDAWIAEYVTGTPASGIPTDLSPAPYYPAQPRDAAQAAHYEHATKRGEELLRAGQVAAFTVAGGQGTRLGFDGPKGTFPISVIRRKALFQLFAERLLRFGQRYGKPIPWYLMTSPANDAPTRAFFAQHKYFGLQAEQVQFFSQGMMPSFGLDGKLLLASKHSLALSPDGHGGSLLALHKSGALADMAARGVVHISYFQVDNPLVSVVSPLFLGLHDLEGAEMSNRMLPKTGPFEKLGCFCVSQGRLQIIEYSDLPEALATQTDARGQLRFIAGSPAIHVLRRDFVERLNAGHFQLPFHRAVKKVPCVDTHGELVNPDKPNGVKLETFVFDALPLAKKALILEAVREREFAPVKNASGVDSVESCQELLQEEAARWLSLRGTSVPRQANGKLACKLEISYRRFADEADFIAGPLVGLPAAVPPGAELVIG